MNKPKFVIGIGSQRAGSTLLHRILDECTDIFMHPVKELHYFDTLYNVRHQDVLTKYSKAQLDREFERLIASKEHGYIANKKYKCFLRTNKLLHENKVEDIDYKDLFRPCLMGNEMIGEITPEYMILPEEAIKYMAEVIGSESPIILITRDPIERFVSAFKLLKVYGKEKVDMSNFEEELLSVFEEMPTWVDQQRKLNSYLEAENKYKKYFSSFLSITYEELISKDKLAISKLESILNVKINQKKVDEILKVKTNQIGETKALSSKTLTALAKYLEA
ncbi:sulfotransferase [Pseudoalteromonas carrageenovora]|uniref:sulfotransferase n=1 Tax=Pseudoalteromonas carrageenovora TaxID=227 RepID=UPI0026E1EFBB|nr:sulfotransferase [Pseudoalteromonas carrageenovora]MDO6463650.1 sulfotransferase [Pseudoalteromonas carrageenovora]